MKITCTKSELMNGINIALRSVPSKSVMPILESFLIAAKDDITITSNDNDMEPLALPANGQILTRADNDQYVLNESAWGHLFISHQASPNARATINILPTLAAIESPDSWEDTMLAKRNNCLSCC